MFSVWIPVYFALWIDEFASHLAEKPISLYFPIMTLWKASFIEPALLEMLALALSTCICTLCFKIRLFVFLIPAMTGRAEPWSPRPPETL